MKQVDPIAGFTLIELLLALTLISILTALATPLLQEYRANANDSTANSDLKSSVQLLIYSQK